MKKLKAYIQNNDYKVQKITDMSLDEYKDHIRNYFYRKNSMITGIVDDNSFLEISKKGEYYYIRIYNTAIKSEKWIENLSFTDMNNELKNYYDYGINYFKIKNKQNISSYEKFLIYMLISQLQI